MRGLRRPGSGLGNVNRRSASGCSNPARGTIPVVFVQTMHQSAARLASVLGSKPLPVLCSTRKTEGRSFASPNLPIEILSRTVIPQGHDAARGYDRNVGEGYGCARSTKAASSRLKRSGSSMKAMWPTPSYQDATALLQCLSRCSVIEGRTMMSSRPWVARTGTDSRE